MVDNFYESIPVIKRRLCLYECHGQEVQMPFQRSENKFEWIYKSSQFYNSDEVGIHTTTYSVAIRNKVFIAQHTLSNWSWTYMELFRLWYSFSANGLCARPCKWIDTASSVQ